MRNSYLNLYFSNLQFKLNKTVILQQYLVIYRLLLIYLFIFFIFLSYLSSDLFSRESFPLVSTRESPNYNMIGFASLEGKAAVYIRAEYRPRFNVYFVATFFHEL